MARAGRPRPCASSWAGGPVGRRDPWGAGGGGRGRRVGDHSCLQGGSHAAFALNRFDQKADGIGRDGIAQGIRIAQIDVLDAYKVRARIGEHYVARVGEGLSGTFSFAARMSIAARTSRSVATGSVIWDGVSQTQPYFDVVGDPHVVVETALLLGFLALLTGLVLLDMSYQSFPGGQGST